MITTSYSQARNNLTTSRIEFDADAFDDLTFWVQQDRLPESGLSKTKL